MTYRKVITMTGWRRPDYTKQVLDALQQCIGFEEYILLPTLESGYPDVAQLFDNVPNCEVVINKERLGCATNTLKALQRGFDRSDFVIHMEDDTVPGIDSLKYFEYINQRYKDDKRIFTTSAYNRINSINPENYFSVKSCMYFTGCMWATWRDRFEEMKNNWDFVDKYGWDVNINKNIRGNRLEIIPTLSRSRNIGEKLGTYTTPKLWRNEQYNSIWVNNYSLEVFKILYGYNKLSKLSNQLYYPYFEIISSNCPENAISPEKKGILTSLGIIIIGNLIKCKNKDIGNFVQGFGIGSGSGIVAHVIDRKLHSSMPHHDAIGLVGIPSTFILDKTDIIKNKDITNNLYGISLGLLTQHLMTEGCSICGTSFCHDGEILC